MNAQEMERLARKLWGEPNPALTSRLELRFGRNGSKSVDLKELTWFDHEAGAGGGYQMLRERAGETPRSDTDTSAIYDYRDERGTLLFQVLRKTPKRFLQRRPDPGAKDGWAWNLRGIRRVPYRLPELRAAGSGDPVFIPEGEKDVDNLRAVGLVATCNPGGAGKWRREFVEHLRGRDVVVLPDNDLVGREHAADVARQLADAVRSVRIVALPDLPEKADVSDWFASGGTADVLLALADATMTEAARSANGAGAKRAAEQDEDDLLERMAHPDISVLRLNRRPPPALPLDVFGDAWGAWIVEAAEAAGCAADFVAAPLLATASALIGNARWAQATEGWSEPPHMWICAVGDSGDGKSPGADSLMRDVLPELERRMASDFPDKLRDWQAAAEAHAAAEESWKKDVREARKLGNAPPLPPSDIPAQPQAPRVRVSDVTIERVATLLSSSSPKGLLITRDELLGWVAGMTAYNDAGRAFWVEAYGGRPYSVERQKHPVPIKIPYLVVSVYGTTQPEKIAELLAAPDDGLLARIAMCWPEPVPFRLGERPPRAHWAIASLDRLRLLDLAPSSEPDAPARPVMTPLVPAARPRLSSFAREMQGRQQEAAGLMRSALGKARGLALRLSLIIEFLWWCGAEGFATPPAGISERAFAAAGHLVSNYFMPMAERVYGDAALPAAERNVTTLARWIVKEHAAEVHVRKLQREVRLPGLREASSIHAACDDLIEAGWLLPAEKVGRREGRPRQAYAVNRKLWDVLS